MAADYVAKHPGRHKNDFFNLLISGRLTGDKEQVQKAYEQLEAGFTRYKQLSEDINNCLLYTSDAADDLLTV